MSDPSAAAQPQVPTAVPTLEDRQIAQSRAREEARQSRRAGAVAKLNAAHAAAPAELTEAPAEPARPAPAPAAPAEAKPTPAPAKPPAEPKVEPDKPGDKPTDKPADDPAAQRGLAQIERARKNFLDERAAKDEELSRREARIAQREAALEGNVKSVDELSKLSLPDLLDKLKLDDAKLTQLSRESYYRTAEGQKNPAAKQAVDEVRQRASLSTMEERNGSLERELAELKQELESTRKLIFQREYANEWTEGTLKEVPADKPTHFAKLLAKDPRGAKQQLLILGGELEKESGAAPTASEVLAEFEKRERAFLESRGYDPDLVLAAKPAAAAPAVPAQGQGQKPPARTLQPGATQQITRPDAVPKNREERRENAIAKIRMRQRSTADQVP